MSYDEKWKARIKNCKSVNVKSSVETIWSENYRFRIEAFQFLLQEVQYGITMCEVSGDTNRPLAFKRLSSKFVALKEALEVLGGHIRIAFVDGGERGKTGPKWENRAFQEYLNDIDASLALLGQVIQAITNSIVFRKYRGASAASQSQTSDLYPAMRLSEIHLDYPDTLRGIEAIVNDYFTKIRKGFLPEDPYGDLSPPIMQVARGQSFAFQNYCDMRYFPIFMANKKLADGTVIPIDLSEYIEKDDVEALKRHCHANESSETDERVRYYVPSSKTIDFVRYQIQFSQVIAPRFFPVMIRYSPVFTHELFHPIYGIARLIGDRSHIQSPRVDIEDLREETFAESGRQMGTPIMKLFDSIVQMESSLRIAMPVIVNAASLVSGISRDHLSATLANNRVDAVQNYAKEILCDICGVVVSKFSYVASQLFHGFSDNGISYLNSSNLLSSTHPPWIVRYKIVAHIARELGFGSVIDRLDGYLDTHLDGISHGHAILECWKTWDEGWWKNAKDSLIGPIVQSFQELMPPSGLFKECAKADSEHGPWGYTYEMQKVRQISGIYNQWIDNRKLCWDDEGLLDELLRVRVEGFSGKPLKLDASDVINILWLKCLDPSNTGRQRLQWRLVLKNNFGERHDRHPY